MEIMKLLKREKTTPASNLDRLTPRQFIRGAALVGAIMVGGACSDGGAPAQTDPSIPATASPTPPPNLEPITSTSLQPVETTAPIEVVDTTVATSTHETSVPKEESFIDVESLTDGQKVYDQVVTQPDGTEVMNLPVFVSFMDGSHTVPGTADENGNPLTVSQNILNNKGVLLEVVKNETTPNIGEDPLFPTEQALPGQAGRVQSFAHRKTHVDVDRDGDGQGDDGVKESMYEHIDQIQVGATMTLTTPDGKVMKYIAIDGGTVPGLAYRVVTDVTQPNGSPDYDKAKLYRGQETGGENIYSMVACHPWGSAKDRIIVEWLQIEG